MDQYERVEYFRRSYEEALRCHKAGEITDGQLALEHEIMDKAFSDYWDTDAPTRKLTIPHLPDLEFVRQETGAPSYLWRAEAFGRGEK